MTYPGKKTFILLLFSLCGLSCAYFNTFYNAEEYFKTAEKEVLDSEDRAQLSKKTIDGFDKTIEKCSTILSEYPESKFQDDALFLRGKALFYRGSYLKAIDSFNRIILEEPESSYALETRLWLVRCQWKIGEQDSAKLGLQELLGEIDQLPAKDLKRQLLAIGYETAAEIYLEQGEMDSVIYYYGETAKQQKRGNQRSRLYYKMAELAFKRSLYDVASDNYKKVIQYSRNSKHVENSHLQIVKILRIEKRWENTTSEIQKLLVDNKFVSIRAQLYLELAKLYEMQSKTNEAINRYELITKEFQRSESSAEAYFNLGQITLKTGKGYEEARKYYASVEKERRTSMFAPSAKTKVKEIDAIIKVIESIKQLEEPRVLSDSVITDSSSKKIGKRHDDTDRDSTIVLNELAEKMYSYGELLSFHFDEPDSGIKIFQRLVDEIPSSARRSQALFSLTYLYRNKNEPETSERYARQLVSEYPLSEYAEKVSISVGLEVHDQAEDILRNAETAALINPEDALVIYQIVVEQYPSSRFVPVALMAMANICDYELSDLDQSLHYYERLIGEFPETEQTQHIKTRYDQLREIKDSIPEDSESETSDNPGDSSEIEE